MYKSGCNAEIRPCNKSVWPSLHASRFMAVQVRSAVGPKLADAFIKVARHDRGRVMNERHRPKAWIDETWTSFHVTSFQHLLQVTLN